MNKVLLNEKVNEFIKIFSRANERVRTYLEGNIFNDKDEEITIKVFSIKDLDTLIKHFLYENILEEEEKEFFINGLISHFEIAKQLIVEFKRNDLEKLIKDGLPPYLKSETEDAIEDYQKIIKYLKAEMDLIMKPQTPNYKTEDVKQIVTTKKGQQQVEPIWWQGSNRLLGFLIEELEKNKLISINGEINKLIKEHFIDKNKEKFKDSISQNRSGATKPKGHKLIEDIIKAIKEPKKD
jgi:hypothetical protein